MAIKKYDFNVSYSAIDTRDKCERMFYYGYILKLKQEKTIDAYGDAGTVVHSVLETTHNIVSELEVKKIFNELWESKLLHTTNRGVFNDLLKKNDYWNAVILGKSKNYDIIKREEKFEQQDDYLLKGFIDIVATTKDLVLTDKELKTINENPSIYLDVVVVDWKTNSKFKTEHYNQMYFYAYLYFRKYGKLPKKFIWEYLKIDKTRSKVVTYDDVINVNNKIKQFISDIHSKKEFSDWSVSPDGVKTNCTSGACFFCGYKNRCREVDISETEEQFNLVLKQGRIYFNNKTTPLFDKIIDKYFSYCVSDNKKQLAMIIKAVKIKTGNDWDGIYHMKRYGYYSIGLLNKLIFYINQYAEATGKQCPITITDQRKTFPQTTEFRGKLILDFELNEHQNEAVESILKEKMGIISIPTSGGKTIIAAEIYRKIPKNTLFVVDRKILLTQGIKELENSLGIKGQVGTITDGVINIESNLTIATIQTINNRLKIDKIDPKTDYEPNELKKLKEKIEIQKIKNKEMLDYLKDVETIISDECHINKSKQYDNLFKNSINTKYRIGLSGTPDLNAINSLELHKSLGFVVYKIPIQNLISKGIVMKPKIEFLNYDCGFIMEGDFNDVQEQLFEHEKRNNTIINICEQNKGKVIMLLVNRISHGKLLQEQLKQKKIDCFFIQGSVTEKARETILDDARSGHSRILIGTSSIVSKGLNLKSLEIIVNCTGNASSIMTIQSLGRVLRVQEGKENAIYYDFNDDMPFFKEHTEERIMAFRNEGHDVIVN